MPVKMLCVTGGGRPAIVARAFASLALVLAVAPPCSAQTSAPPAPAVIHACYVPLTGTLYRIDETGLRQGCSSSSHVEFSWTDGAGAVRPTDALAGDLGGTFAAPFVVGLQGHALSAVVPTAGQVLTFDGTKWGPAAATATFANATINGSFLAAGTSTSGIPATGPGARMMWYANKWAFRAGEALSGEWDDANVGTHSVAMGWNVKASGDASTAIGEGNVASGDYAIATGAITVANGGNSTAMGRGSIASGFVSTALGNLTVASGLSSTAMGERTEASGDRSTVMGSLASTNGQVGSFVYGDNSTMSHLVTVVKAVVPNQFVVRAQNIWLGTTSDVTATPGRFLETSTGAYLSSGGVWTNVSDVNKKQAFEAISGEDVLSRLAAMPIEKWSYKSEDASIRHLGPTAQDFYAAFHLGLNNTSIGTIDADGVSLAAIKALAQRTTTLASENARLRAENERLNARMDALEAALATLGAAPRPR